MIAVSHVDAKAAERRMCQEAAPEERVMLGLDGAALAHALHALGAAATRPMQAQPVAAGLQPGADRTALCCVRVRASDVGDQHPAHRQPLLDVREVVTDRRRNVALAKKTKQRQARMVVIVAGARTGRVAPSDDMRAGKFALCHWITSLLGSDQTNSLHLQAYLLETIRD